MSMKVVLYVMGLVLLTSAINLPGETQQQLRPSFIAKKASQVETNQSEGESDANQDDDQAGDFSLKSDRDEDGDSEANVTLALPTSNDPVKRTLDSDDWDDDLYDFQDYSQKTESRDMEDFDLEEGDLSYEGHLNFAIVTAYSDDLDTSGAVYVLTDKKSESKAIITGLEKPVNVCFGEENELLYVVDAKSDDEGFIYQFEIDWDAGDEVPICTEYEANKCVEFEWQLKNDKFELDSKSYAIVYEGSAATDCACDSFGNLYFATVDNHIYGISVVDLYARQLNANQELLDETAVGGCTGIDIRKNGELWWTNSQRTDTLGTLASMSWDGSDLLDQKRVEVQYSAGPATGLALKKNYAYFISDDTLDEYKISTGEVTQTSLRSGMEPKSVGYGGGQVWIADNGNGKISRTDDNFKDDSDFSTYVSVPGAHGVHLINSDVERMNSSFAFGAYISVTLALWFL